MVTGPWQSSDSGDNQTLSPRLGGLKQKDIDLFLQSGGTGDRKRAREREREREGKERWMEGEREEAAREKGEKSEARGRDLKSDLSFKLPKCCCQSECGM